MAEALAKRILDACNRAGVKPVQQPKQDRVLPTMEFVRVERDCAHNKKLRADGDVRGVIYDFDVLIDGYKRAQMERDTRGRGYHLQDADGRPIDPPIAQCRTGREIGSKADFLSIVTKLLEAGKIPTLADMAMKREAEAQKRRDKIAAEKEAQRLNAIGRHSLVLYEALKAIRDMPLATSPRQIEAAGRVLKVVDEQAEKWMAAVDADPGRYGIS